MSIKMKASVDDRALKARFEQAKLKVNRNGSRIIMRGAYRILRESQIEVPRRTGFLANTKFLNPEQTRTLVEVEIGYSAPYAVYVENAKPGTNFINGKRRFLRDPFRRIRPEVLRELRHLVRSL